MNLKKVTFLLMALSLVFTAAAPAGSVLAQANSPSGALTTLISTYVSTPPVLDGSLNFGEWNYGANVPFHDGFISAVNDGTRLYVLLDVTGETVNDSSDYFWVTFDKNKNTTIDANTDLNYGLPIGTRNMRYQYYLGPGSWTGVTANTYSARASGFGCFWADGSFNFISFFPLRISCSPHRVWELAFDLAEIGASAGSTAKMGVRVAGTKPAFTDDTPANFAADFTNLIAVNLAPLPYLTMAPFKGARVAFEQNFNANPVQQPIEITQAVQRTDDSLALVSNKDTVARVYTITGNVPFAETAKTYLYGDIGGADLPGSPMVVTQRAPTVINKNNLNDSANFLLPKSWVGPAAVNFSAKAVGQLADTAATGSIPLAFTHRGTLTVWIVPVNTGSVASPVLPPQSEIERQKSYLRTIYPLSNVNFVQKNWSVLGVVMGEPITALNTYYNNVVFAWIISIIFPPFIPPYTLPDQIYGFTPSGGGLSDPVWAGGGGHVGRGFQGTSMEGTMAHEINHNLDKSSPGTWGRHVSPGGTGCGAAGPDPSWPYGDPFIHTLGFDTRLPWSTGGSRDTVIPTTFPDIMSYCQSGLLPTKWISDYRWTNLFNDFVTLPLQPQAVYTTHYYVSGRITQDPMTKVLTGKLEPVLVQLGVNDFPKPNLATDNIGIQFQYDGANGPTSITYPFTADFTPDPEEPVNSVYFNFSFPQLLGPTGGPATVTAVNLIQLPSPIAAPAAGPIDAITVSSTLLSITLTAPVTAGATLSGPTALTWTVNNTLANDTFNVEFSGDTGKTWNTLASNLKGVNTYAVDTTLLPNTVNPDAARFRVVGTDGFNNDTKDTVDVLIVNAGVKPAVNITSPLPSGAVSSNPTVTLEGNGSSPTDGPLPDDHLYWTEGATHLGNGASLVVNLSTGIHTITLTAVTTEGTQNSTSINVLIGYPVYLPTVNK